MKPGKNQKIAFFVIIAALVALPVYFILKSEAMLSDQENIYRFRPFRLVDPHDIMRGDYLVIDFNTSVRLRNGEKSGRGKELYVTVEKDSAGYAFFDYASVQKPEGSNYFTTEALGSAWRDSMVFIKIPFDKYFINAENAKLAEQLYQIEVRNPETNMYIEVAIADGESLLKDIYVDSIPLNKFLNGLSAEERKEIQEIYKERGVRPRRGR